MSWILLCMMLVLRLHPHSAAIKTQGMESESRVLGCLDVLYMDDLWLQHHLLFDGEFGEQVHERQMQGAFDGNPIFCFQRLQVSWLTFW